MVLQTKYFYVQEMNLLRQSSNDFVVVSLDKIVVEITAQRYEAGKRSINQHSFVCAHEVAFDSMGKRSCNLSM